MHNDRTWTLCDPGTARSGPVCVEPAARCRSCFLDPLWLDLSGPVLLAATTAHTLPCDEDWMPKCAMRRCLKTAFVWLTMGQPVMRE